MKKKDLLGIVLFYVVIVLGVIIVNGRFEQIDSCENKGNSRNYCIETFEK